jgi:hypothetical protein
VSGYRACHPTRYVARRTPAGQDLAAAAMALLRQRDRQCAAPQDREAVSLELANQGMGAELSAPIGKLMARQAEAR